MGYAVPQKCKDFYLFNFYFWAHEAEFISIVTKEFEAHVQIANHLMSHVTWDWSPVPTIRSYLIPSQKLWEVWLWWDTRKREGACEFHHRFCALTSFIKWLRNDIQLCSSPPPLPQHGDAHPLLACETCLERGRKPKSQNPTFLLRAVCVHTLDLWPSFLVEQGFLRLWVRSLGLLRCSCTVS